MTLLEITDLSVTLPNGNPLVDSVSLTVAEREVVGVVGESGSGKTMTGMSVLGMVPEGLQVSGSATLDGRELLTQTPAQWQHTRGNDVAMVLQDPHSSLHPHASFGGAAH